MMERNSNSRSNIFAAIRKSLNVSGEEENRKSAVRERLALHPQDIIPGRVKVPRAELISLFANSLESQSADVFRVDTASEVPNVVSDYLRKKNLPLCLRMGEDHMLGRIPWETRQAMEIARGPAHPDDMVSISRAAGGAAETGTLFLTSGRENPTTLNFLPDTHIILIFERDIHGSYEEIWQLIRQGSKSGRLPRTINLIGGPSRTADIEQTIIMGAHGPRRLVVLIVSDPN